MAVRKNKQYNRNVWKRYRIGLCGIFFCRKDLRAMVRELWKFSGKEEFGANNMNENAHMVLKSEAEF